jgi:hypothetical protein
MLSISRILPAGVVAVLLAGCGPSGPVDRVSGAPTPSPSATSQGPVDTSRIQGVDSAPADAPTTLATTTAAPVPSACGLIHRADVVTAVAGAVTLEFPQPATEETRSDFLVGSASICHIPLRSRFTGPNGDSGIASGSVTVQIQTAGASDYFPVHGDDTPVTGIGDEAMVRHAALYVRIGTGMLVLTVAITAAADSARRDVEWAEKLAPVAIGRL